MRGEHGGFPWSALCCFCLLAGREGSPSGISAVLSEHLEGCAPSPVWGGEISLDLGSGCPEGSHTEAIAGLLCRTMAFLSLPLLQIRPEGLGREMEQLSQSSLHRNIKQGVMAPATPLQNGCLGAGSGS